jgi:hypothetical protein
LGNRIGGGAKEKRNKEIIWRLANSSRLKKEMVGPAGGVCRQEKDTR